MMRITTAFLFAAGKGSRLLPLTATLPKPLVEVNGKSLLLHSIEWLLNAGITHLIINTHHLAPQVQQMVVSLQANQMIPSHCKVTVLYEPLLLETGGAIYAALPLINEEVILGVNTDLIFVPSITQAEFLSMCALWDATKMDALLMTCPAEKTLGFEGGDFALMAPQGGLCPIHWGTEAERPHLEKPWIYPGVQLLACKAIQKLGNRAGVMPPIFSTRDVWLEHLSPSGILERTFAMQHQKRCMQVSRPENIVEIEENM
jgi:MurNAc alpha-1-phosphate uridylyltransferase